MATGRWRAAVTNDFVVTKHDVAKTVNDDCHGGVIW